MKSSRKQQRIKLVKDLSQGQNNLCQSLVDMSQFQNVDQQYQKRKAYFNITKRKVNFQAYIPISQQQKQYDMTPLQKLGVYKKLRNKEKFNFQYSNQSMNKVFKIRKSKIPNMLNHLNQSIKKQSQQIFQKQIKVSQQKLKFFRSQGKLKQNLKNNTLSKFKNKQSENRCRFFSLKNGKPQMNQKLFPTFEQYVDGKNRAKLQQKYIFDIHKLQKSLNYFHTQSDENSQYNNQFKYSIIPSMLPIKKRNKFLNNQSNYASQRTNISKTQVFNIKKNNDDDIQKIHRYSNLFINKTQKSSKKIVKTMENFYQCKNHKKQEYNNMVQFYDHDRPLTNQIRRTQYALSINEKLKSINFYRNQSQNKRIQILSNNSSTYLQLLQILSKYHQDDIPISLQILRQMRQLMKRQYVFTQNDVYQLLKEIKDKSQPYFKRIKQQNPEEDSQDFMMQPVINIINKKYNYNFIWDNL